jgi:phosphoenolpyruvate---glycerone phosphotransferase subunit DhaL
MDAKDIRLLIDTLSDRIIAASDELTALDQAIGDGDHGINMKRGFEAVKADAQAMAAGDLPAALHKLGMTLVMKVGGASGPLYGTLFMALAKAMPPDPDRAQLASALASAIAAVKARGKSEVGQKTLLDVLDPVYRALAGGADAEALRSAAREAAKATIPLKATRGRASFLGERSIGHMDPGARSSEIMVGAILDALEQRS